VAIAPFLEALVEIDESLGDERAVSVAAIQRDEDVLDPLVGLGWECDPSSEHIRR